MLQAEGYHPTANRVRDVASPSTLEIYLYPQPSFRLHPHSRPAPTPHSHFTTHLSALIAAPHPRPHSRSKTPLAHVPAPTTTLIPPTSRTLSWSLPLVTLSIPPSTFSYPARSPNATKQLSLRRDSPKPSTPKHIKTPSLSLSQSSRFAHPNPFQCLSLPPFPIDPTHPSLFTSPFYLPA